MREIITELLAAHQSGGAAMATVVQTWRSAPRPAGASRLVTSHGEAVGSDSGGYISAMGLRKTHEDRFTQEPRVERFCQSLCIRTLYVVDKFYIQGSADSANNVRNVATQQWLASGQANLGYSRIVFLGLWGNLPTNPIVSLTAQASVC